MSDKKLHYFAKQAKSFAFFSYIVTKKSTKIFLFHCQGYNDSNKSMQTHTFRQSSEVDQLTNEPSTQFPLSKQNS